MSMYYDDDDDDDDDDDYRGMCVYWLLLVVDILLYMGFHTPHVHILTVSPAAVPVALFTSTRSAHASDDSLSACYRPGCD